jgi:hypothetical protein
VSWLLVSLQNAECVGLFPAPLPRQGFFTRSLQEYGSCVPAAACPGVDAGAVTASYRVLLESHSPQVAALVEHFFLVASRNSTASQNTSVRCPPSSRLHWPFVK